MAKRNEEIIEPELDITDDMGDVPESPKEEKPADVEAILPDIDVEQEPTTVSQKIEVKDADRRGFKQKFRAFVATKKGKVVIALAVLIAIVGVLCAIPLTRYGLLGPIVKKDVTITITDADSKRPVSGAAVELGQYTATSDAKGVARISAVSVGEYRLVVNKKYYKSSASDYVVPVLSAPENAQPSLKATGRSVAVTVTNKIDGSVVANAAISISESSVATDEKGQANIILPVKAEAQKGTVTADNYVATSFEVTVGNTDDQKTSVALTPKGNVYFLSKRTGKINVMKTNLDGTDAKTVVEGTGNEEDQTTVLLASRDWKYLALLARRGTAKTNASLYLVNTTTGELSTMDEGDTARFDLIGWSGSRFVYLVNRNKQVWEDKGQALKSYYAPTGERKTIDETAGYGNSYYNYGSESITGTYILGDQLVYAKSWWFGGYQDITGKKRAIITVNSDANNKKTAKEFEQPMSGGIEARAYEPGAVHYRVGTDTKGEYYEYEDGKLVATTAVNDTDFYQKAYPTYLVSPDGTKTFWNEQRDGKYVLFVGDAKGKNSREVGTSDYFAYGWYTDAYLLVSKGGSELYILGVNSKISETVKPLKITDYHKPYLTYPGYGYGYGGQ